MQIGEYSGSCDCHSHLETASRGRPFQQVGEGEGSFTLSSELLPRIQQAGFPQNSREENSQLKSLFLLRQEIWMKPIRTTMTEQNAPACLMGEIQRSHLNFYHVLHRHFPNFHMTHEETCFLKSCNQPQFFFLQLPKTLKYLLHLAIDETDLNQLPASCLPPLQLIFLSEKDQCFSA